MLRSVSHLAALGARSGNVKKKFTKHEKAPF